MSATTTDGDVVVEEARSGSYVDAYCRRQGVAELDLVVAAIVGLFLVVWAPLFITNTVPRNGLALSLLPLGAAFVVGAARRDGAARAALVVVAVVIASAITAESPVVAFVGQLPEWASVIALTTSLAWWGVGRRVSEPGRLVVARVAAAGAVMNGVVGVIQLLVGVRPGELFLFPNRASGLMSNPVFYGAVLAGVALLWTALASERRTSLRLFATGALTFFAAISGGRVVLASVVVGLVACALVWRTRAILPAASALAGLTAAEVFTRATNSGAAVERLADGESIGSRLAVWRFSLDAFVDRPLLGWGPANYELAVMRRFDLAFAQDYWAEGNPTVWWDPHNVAVLLLVSIGAVGTLAVIAFVGLALRGVIAWPYLIAALVIGVNLLLEPVTVHTLPIVLLLIGLAVRPRTERAPEERSVVDHGVDVDDVPYDDDPYDDDRAGVDRLDGSEPDDLRLPRPQVVALLAGVVIALVVLGSAFLVDRAIEQREPERAAVPALVFDGDPFVHWVLANEFERTFAEGDLDGRHLIESLAQAERAAELFPTAENLVRVAESAANADDVDAAWRALDRAIELTPYDPITRLARHTLATYTGDDDLAASERAVLCDIGTFWCEASDRFETGDPAADAVDD